MGLLLAEGGRGPARAAQRPEAPVRRRARRRQDLRQARRGRGAARRRRRARRSAARCASRSSPPRASRSATRCSSPTRSTRARGSLAEPGKTIHLPDDIVGVDADGNVRHVRHAACPTARKGFDIGPGSAAAFSDVIMDARTVFWNGPMGMFEDERFAAGTRTRRPGDGRHEGVHGRRRRRLGGRARRSSGSTTRSTTCRPAAARRSSCSSSATCPGLAALREAPNATADESRCDARSSPATGR